MTPKEPHPREIDVHPETLRSWVRQYRRENSGAQNSPQIGIDERARLKELERRNRELEMENSFLKKAAAYFAKDPR
ncbi:transposase [Micromonospora sp. Llam0]|uniref:transposase n=1 Tax=Micromonospora sp. Llam0 TaxID=2485143 RepID=UPI0018F59F4F